MRRARRAGWAVDVAPGSSHIRWTAPSGGQVRSAHTPQGRRSTIELRLRLSRLDPAAFGRGLGDEAGEPVQTCPAPPSVGGLADYLAALAALLDDDSGGEVEPVALADWLRGVRGELRVVEDDLRAAARSNSSKPSMRLGA